MAHVMPQNVNRVKRYHDDVPLFSRFQIEHQIESAYSARSACPPAAPSSSTTPRPWSPSTSTRPRHPRRRHRGNRLQDQLRSRRRGGPPAAPARPRRPHRHRLHRHGVAKNQRESRTACATPCALRPRPRPDRQDQPLRPAGTVPPAPAPGPRRDQLSPARAATAPATSAAPNRPLHILRILEEEAAKDNTGALHCQVPVDVTPSSSTRSATTSPRSNSATKVAWC